MAAVKKSLGWRGVLGICAAVAVSLFANPGLAQRAELCIGASWEMTGPLANTGASLRIAVETALDQINAAGGVLGKPIRAATATLLFKNSRRLHQGRTLYGPVTRFLPFGSGKSFR